MAQLEANTNDEIKAIYAMFPQYKKDSIDSIYAVYNKSIESTVEYLIKSSNCNDNATAYNQKTRNNFDKDGSKGWLCDKCQYRNDPSSMYCIVCNDGFSAISQIITQPHKSRCSRNNAEKQELQIAIIESKMHKVSNDLVQQFRDKISKASANCDEKIDLTYVKIVYYFIK